MEQAMIQKHVMAGRPAKVVERITTTPVQNCVVLLKMVLRLLARNVWTELAFEHS